MKPKTSSPSDSVLPPLSDWSTGAAVVVVAPPAAVVVVSPSPPSLPSLPQAARKSARLTPTADSRAALLVVRISSLSLDDLDCSSGVHPMAVVTSAPDQSDRECNC